jgi:hypothetical protein
MSHTTTAARGTTFIHDGDYGGFVRIKPRGQPNAEVMVPFADLRELVFAYLRARRTERAEQATDDQFENDLIT